MGEIVNLRRARKNKARTAKDTEAAANRAKFGTPKTERDRRAAEADLSARQLDGHKREEE
jgi:Domain of unknown function (DUF4169)